jgi:hypothetical protein
MTDLLYSVADTAFAALYADIPVVSNILLVAGSRWMCEFGDRRSRFVVARPGQSVALVSVWGQHPASSVWVLNVSSKSGKSELERCVC